MSQQTAHINYVTLRGGPHDGEQQAIQGHRLILVEPVIRQMYGENRPIETAILGYYEVSMDGYAYWIPAGGI